MCRQLRSIVLIFRSEIEQLLYFPTETEVRRNFVHHSKCPCNREFDLPKLVDDMAVDMFDVQYEWISNLVVVEEEVYVSSGSHWAPGVNVKCHYLLCKYCAEKHQFWK